MKSGLTAVLRYADTAIDSRDSTKNVITILWLKEYKDTTYLKPGHLDKTVDRVFWYDTILSDDKYYQFLTKSIEEIYC